MCLVQQTLIFDLCLRQVQADCAAATNFDLAYAIADIERPAEDGCGGDDASSACWTWEAAAGPGEDDPFAADWRAASGP